MSSESLSFDHETEHFLSNAPTLPEFEPVGALPTPYAPRPALGAWVIGAMIVCSTILAIAYGSG